MRGSEPRSVLGAGPGRPRRRRLSDTETERLMLETAGDAIAELGLTVSLDHLRLEDVIREAGVARSAVYRRWPSKGEFLGDLLLELARARAPMSALGTVLASDHIRKVLSGRDLGTVEARLAALTEVVRVTAEEDFRHVRGSREWRTYLALTVTFAGMEAGELRDRVGEALAESEARFVLGIVRSHDAVLRMLGLRRPPGGPSDEDLAHLANALLRGMVTKALVQPELADDRVDVGPDGAPGDWALVAYGVGRLLVGTVEPDPSRPWDDARAERLRAVLASGADLPDLADGF